MKPGIIRPIAICLIRSGNRAFLAAYQDPSGETFYRPLGGAIEFGEHGRDCIAREVREESGAEVTDVTYLEAVENIFHYGGEKGHEIVLVYGARFADSRMYETDAVRCRDDGGEFLGLWVSLDELRDGAIPLYPCGVLELIAGMPAD